MKAVKAVVPAKAKKNKEIWLVAYKGKWNIARRIHLIKWRWKWKMRIFNNAQKWISTGSLSNSLSSPKENKMISMSYKTFQL